MHQVLLSSEKLPFTVPSEEGQIRKTYNPL